MPLSAQPIHVSAEPRLDKSSGRKAERLEELDSLRGLAALSVVLLHVLNVFPFKDSPETLHRIWYIWYTPLHMFWAGTEAVLLFFILSGFVLSIPFYKGGVQAKAFCIKRVFRIYPAYWVAVSIAFTCRLLIGTGRDLSELSHWFNQVWSNSLTPGFVFNQYLLLGSFQNGKLFPVVWSLVHEMRISLLFPLLMFVMLRTSWKKQLTLAGLLYCIGLLSTDLLRRKLGIIQDYTETLAYIPMFMVGATIARYRYEVAEWWRSLLKRRKIGLLAAGVLAYTYGWWFFPGSRFHILQAPDRIFATVGGAIFVVAALGSGNIKGFLRRPLLVRIGALSYSIYLLHTVILVSLVRLLWGILPSPIIFAVMALLTSGISWLIYERVELPFIHLGKQVVQRLYPKQRLVTKG